MTTTYTPKIGVSVGRAVKRVSTMRGKQAHHGYCGWVAIPGERERTKCCPNGFHQKSKAARACAVREAKRIGKQRGIDVMEAQA